MKKYFAGIVRMDRYAFLLVLSLISVTTTGLPRPCRAENRVGKHILVLKIANEIELLAAKKDLELELDISRCRLPGGTTLGITITRIFPTLRAGGGFEEIDHSFDEFRFFRGDTPTVKNYTMKPRRDLEAAVGHYRVDLCVSRGQHPKIQTQLGDTASKLHERKFVFVGSKSMALEIIQRETENAITDLRGMLAAFKDTDSAGMEQSRRGQPPGSEKEPTDGGDKEDEDTPGNGDNGNKDNGDGEEDNGGEEKKCDSNQGFAAIMRIGSKYFTNGKGLTMPNVAGVLLGVRNNMAQVLRGIIQDESTMTQFDRFCALCEIVVLRYAVLNLHYFLDDAYKKFDMTFAGLVDNPNPELRGKIQEEWSQTDTAARKLWQHLQQQYFNKTYMRKNKDQGNIGELPKPYWQWEADNGKFRILVTEQKFTETVTEYIELLNKLQLAYAELLDNEKTSDRTAKIKILKNKIVELDHSIRTQLRIKGSVEELERELKKAEDALQEDKSGGNE
ncbi:hypothetical protein ACFL54_03630 [Planctomycetota bacterium]